MNQTLYLAELDMTGSYWPLIWAFVFTFLFAASVAVLWTWWSSPARIQKLIRSKGMGLFELKDHFHLRWRDWPYSFLIALLLTIIPTVCCYLLLNQEKYQGLPFWVMLTTSMLSSQTFFEEYRPMPYGILAAFLLGLTFGRLLGLTFGKKLGAKRVLLTSRLRDSLKF